MKNLLLILSLVSTCASAEWTRVAGNEDLDAYVDVATLRKREHIVEVWVLLDYKTSQQWSDYLLYWSMKSQKEYDCKEARQHTLSSALHFAHMGERDSVYTVPGSTAWGYLLPASVDEMLWIFACK